MNCINLKCSYNAFSGLKRTRHLWPKKLLVFSAQNYTNKNSKIFIRIFIAFRITECIRFLFYDRELLYDLRWIKTVRMNATLVTVASSFLIGRDTSLDLLVSWWLAIHLTSRPVFHHREIAAGTGVIPLLQKKQKQNLKMKSLLFMDSLTPALWICIDFCGDIHKVWTFTKKEMALVVQVLTSLSFLPSSK